MATTLYQRHIVNSSTLAPTSKMLARRKRLIPAPTTCQSLVLLNVKKNRKITKSNRPVIIINKMPCGSPRELLIRRIIIRTMRSGIKSFSPNNPPWAVGLKVVINRQTLSRENEDIEDVFPALKMAACRRKQSMRTLWAGRLNVEGLCSELI